MSVRAADRKKLSENVRRLFLRSAKGTLLTDRFRPQT
jgi:hypothetical protein